MKPHHYSLSKPRLFLHMEYLLTVLVSIVFTVSSSPAAEKPNIVIIFADDMDTHDWGAYGSELMTPTLDRVSGEGVRFENAFCVTAACTPSRFNVLTGRYSGRSRHPWFTGRAKLDEPYCVQWNTFIVEDDVSIAEQMKRGGYLTGMAGKWHAGHVEGRKKSDYPEIAPNADLDSPDTDALLAAHQKMLVDDIKALTGFDYVGGVVEGNAPRLPVKALRTHHLEWMTHHALRFMDMAAEKEQPFFLYLTPTTIHSPGHEKALDVDVRYTPEGRLPMEAFAASPPRAEVRQRLEDAGIQANHRSVGALMLDDMVAAVDHKLQELGVAENTLLFVLGDHGVEPGKLACYRIGSRAPMILRWPAGIDAGQTSRDVISYVDIPATAMAVGGVSSDPSFPIDGVPFLAPGKRSISTERRFAYTENGYTRGVINGDFNFIAFRFPNSILEKLESGALDMAPDHADMPNLEQPLITMRSFPNYYDYDQLYDLRIDPFEQENIVSDPSYASTVAEMKDELRSVLATFDQPFPLDDPGFMATPEFKALGAKKQNDDIQGENWWWQKIREYKDRIAAWEAEKK